MNCICNHLKLPKMNKYELVKCVKISMDNGENYTIKIGDIVGIQFLKNDKQILLRKGRVKDIVIVNRRTLCTTTDNVSHIILDCSEQFSIKIIEIKLKDIIKIGNVDDVFEDYSDRITELEPNFIEGDKLPVRQHGLVTKEEIVKKITKPDKEDVVKMDPSTGEFDDLYEMNQYRPDVEELKIQPEEEPETKPTVLSNMMIMM